MYFAVDYKQVDLHHEKIDTIKWSPAQPKWQYFSLCCCELLAVQSSCNKHCPVPNNWPAVSLTLLSGRVQPLCKSSTFLFKKLISQRVLMGWDFSLILCALCILSPGSLFNRPFKMERMLLSSRQQLTERVVVKVSEF